MRIALATLLALPLAALAAEPKEPPKQPGQVYFESLFKTADLLAKVTDEKTAQGAKAKLDEWYVEGRKDRKALFAQFGDEKPSDQLVAENLMALSKGLTEVNAKIAGEYACIGSNQKEAFKVLNGTKLFLEYETVFQERAMADVSSLVLAAQATEAKFNGPIKKLADLAPYLEKGNKALTDPWGFPYQFKYVEDEKEKRTRFVVYTVNPYSKKTIGYPKELLELIDK